MDYEAYGDEEAEACSPEYPCLTMLKAPNSTEWVVCGAVGPHCHIWPKRVNWFYQDVGEIYVL